MVHGSGRGPGRAFDTIKYKRARSTKVLVSSLWKYLKRYIWPIIYSTGFILLYSLTSLVTPFIAKLGIDKVTGTSETFSALIPLTILFLALTALGWVFHSISVRIMSKMNSKMLHEVRMDLYEKLSFSDMSYLKNEQSGNITARVTADTGELATGVQLSTSILSQVLLIIGSFILLVTTNWIIALISLAAIPVAFLIAGVLSYFGRRIILRVRRAFGFVSGKMAEGLSGIAVAKSFNREEELSTELRELNQKHYNYSKQFGMLMMFVMPSVSALSYLLFTMIVYVSGWINKTTNVLSLGDIYLSVNLSQQFLFPIIMLAMSFPQLESAFGAMDRIIDIFEAKRAVSDVHDAVNIQTTDDSVHFKNISFAYEEDNYVLKDIIFSVNPGELVAVVGHTGAGKTTLFSSLLTRFYDIEEGTISIGNQDIKSVTQSSLRQAIGLVTQEPFLFTGTVMENILYGAPNATKEDVKEICKKINADEFIDALPNGYDTLVVEGGKKLSSGQRQIITIARTMLADPRILVLDEATSRLDAYTESLVQAAQRELFKERTTFVIAHRLSTISDAEKIVVLDHGKLVEIGSHKELMDLDGIYADLYKTYYVHQGLAEIDVDVEDLEPEELEEPAKNVSPQMIGMIKGDHMSGKNESSLNKEETRKHLEKMSPEDKQKFMKRMKEQKKLK